MRLRPIPVTHPAHVESMRRMRNRCAAGFATFNGQISEDEQTTWWAANKDRVRAWLYADDTQSTKVATFIVGFGLIRQHDDGRWFTTVGVLPEATGHDYGKEITHHLIAQVPGKCWGIARRDNPAAVKLHVARDWQAIEGPDPALVYFRTWREGSLETLAPLDAGRVGEHLSDSECNADEPGDAHGKDKQGYEPRHVDDRQPRECQEAKGGRESQSHVENQTDITHTVSVAEPRRVDPWAGRTVEPWPPDGAVEEWSAAGWVTS